MTDNSFSPQSGNAVLTPEGIFISLYVDALRSLQRTWMDTEKPIDKDHFNIQIIFLTNMIPDAFVRNRIRAEMDKVRTEYKNTDQGQYAEQHAGLTVVTHMVEFLCNSFDLVHLDINGPATSRQYRDAVLEIPDYEPTKKEEIPPPLPEDREPAPMEPAAPGTAS